MLDSIGKGLIHRGTTESHSFQDDDRIDMFTTPKNLQETLGCIDQIFIEMRPAFSILHLGLYWADCKCVPCFVKITYRSWIANNGNGRSSLDKICIKFDIEKL